MSLLWHPALILFAGAILIGLTRGRLRAAVVMAAPILALIAAWLVPDGVSLTAKFLSYQLELVEGDGMRRLFGATFASVAFAAGLFGVREAGWYELSAGYAHAAGALGIAFAGDVVSLFLYWQAMVICSTALIWSGGTPEARAAGIRFAILHLIGGLIFKIGIEGVIHHTGGIDIQVIQATDFYSWASFIGVLVSAAGAPVSVWLADAYPRSSPVGSVFLPAFMTASAVLVLLQSFPGEPALIGVGLVMIFYGIVYGLFEGNLRRLLSYGLISQLGFVLCAIGVGTRPALASAAVMAIAQALAFTLLFMTASAVIRQTGRERIGELGALGRKMPFTALCAAVGALAVSALPLAAGFITLRAIEGAASPMVYWLVAAGSMGVLLHAGLKFPWMVFIETPRAVDANAQPDALAAARARLEADAKTSRSEQEWHPPVTDAPPPMTAAMGLLAALTFALGVLPQTLYALLPGGQGYPPYVLRTVGLYLALLLVSGVAFFLLRPLMARAKSIPIDVDWLWRVLLFRLGTLFVVSLRVGADLVRDLYVRMLRQPLRDWVARRLGPEGTLSRTWSIGTTALWVAVLLSAYLAIYFFVR